MQNAAHLLSPHVLAVDDDPAVRQLVSEYLAENELRVTAVARSLSGFGSGPRRGELPCQARRQRGVWRGHTTSWQRRLARQITSALRVGPAKGLSRRKQSLAVPPGTAAFCARALRPWPSPGTNSPQDCLCPGSA